ncbi:MAG: molybdenum cofactor biosynthesis protein MoaE [Chlamydiota bacterium]|nr:molybdenum cofactor biosynthesis protein MoaE [Chlamydiota bacterium]
MYITKEPIEAGSFLKNHSNPECGAFVQFIGVVRNQHQGRKVKRLFYDCYEPMAEKQIQNIIASVKKKFPVDEVLLRHRIGCLEIGETAIVISVSAAHRDEAFLACREIIENIKEKVPIWKKEEYEDGTYEWIVRIDASKQ